MRSLVWLVIISSLRKYVCVTVRNLQCRLQIINVMVNFAQGNIASLVVEALYQNMLIEGMQSVAFINPPCLIV
jgi:hypothetical protein